MGSHGRSLYVDDPTYLAAAHFQNHRVPADQACYTCHTNYAMFGGFRAKFNGLHHVYVQYFGTPHDPIRLYEPYNNRECLHCHLGARSFEEGAVHTADPDLLPAVKANKISCLSSGCHDVVHNVGQLSTVKFWKGDK
jgi:cytochrome c-type protein NapC